MLSDSWDLASFCKLELDEEMLWEDLDRAFPKVYGFDIQVVSASWGTEPTELSMNRCGALGLTQNSPPTTRAMAGNSEKLDVCKGVI